MKSLAIALLVALSSVAQAETVFFRCADQRGNLYQVTTQGGRGVYLLMKEVRTGQIGYLNTNCVSEQLAATNINVGIRYDNRCTQGRAAGGVISIYTNDPFGTPTSGKIAGVITHWYFNEFVAQVRATIPVACTRGE